jgi:hypothetical protein
MLHPVASKRPSIKELLQHECFGPARQQLIKDKVEGKLKSKPLCRLVEE